MNSTVILTNKTTPVNTGQSVYSVAVHRFLAKSSKTWMYRP